MLTAPPSLDLFVTPVLPHLLSTIRRHSGMWLLLSRIMISRARLQDPRSFPLLTRKNFAIKRFQLANILPTPNWLQISPISRRLMRTARAVLTANLWDQHPLSMPYTTLPTLASLYRHTLIQTTVRHRLSTMTPMQGHVGQTPERT